MLYVGRLHNGDETRVQTHDCCAALAGRVQRIARRKARLVFEEVSLVHGLVECSIVLLPRLLLAAPRRDEVEATPASQLRAFSNPAKVIIGKVIGKVTVLPGCRRSALASARS